MPPDFKRHLISPTCPLEFHSLKLEKVPETHPFSSLLSYPSSENNLQKCIHTQNRLDLWPYPGKGINKWQQRDWIREEEEEQLCFTLSTRERQFNFHLILLHWIHIRNVTNITFRYAPITLLFHFHLFGCSPNSFHTFCLYSRTGREKVSRVSQPASQSVSQCPSQLSLLLGESYFTGMKNWSQSDMQIGRKERKEARSFWGVVYNGILLALFGRK